MGNFMAVWLGCALTFGNLAMQAELQLPGPNLLKLAAWGVILPVTILWGIRSLLKARSQDGTVS